MPVYFFGKRRTKQMLFPEFSFTLNVVMTIFKIIFFIKNKNAHYQNIRCSFYFYFT